MIIGESLSHLTLPLVGLCVLVAGAAYRYSALESRAVLYLISGGALLASLVLLLRGRVDVHSLLLLAESQKHRPVPVTFGAVLVLFGMAAFAAPLFSVLTLSCGYLYGFWLGSAVVGTASSLAAIFAFQIARRLLRARVLKLLESRPVMKKLRERAAGWKLALAMRLACMPWGVVNMFLALSPISSRAYCATLAGSAPVALIGVYFGSSLGNLTEPWSYERRLMASIEGALALAFLVGAVLTGKRMVKRISEENEA